MATDEAKKYTPDGAEKTRLPKVLLNVRLTSTQVKEGVVDELIKSKLVKTSPNGEKEEQIMLEVDEMPTSQAFDILVTAYGILEEDLTTLVLPLIRRIPGIEEVEPVKPLSHNEVQLR